MNGPNWIDEREVLALHARLLEIDGGARGLRELGLLKSALARPQQLFAYDDSPDIIDLAACYAAGFIRNHPFIDGNTRIGFIACVLFLEITGYRFMASEEAAATAVMELAAGKLSEAEFVAWLRKNTRDETG